MPIAEFKCPAGHTQEQFLERADFEVARSRPCNQCPKRATRVDISTTGTPILKAGVGGFHKPTV